MTHSPGAQVSVPANAFYMPSPVVLLVTLGPDDLIDISTMSAAGALCLEPAIVGVGIKPSRRSYRHIRQRQHFTLSLPLVEHLDAADFLGTRKLARHPDKVKKSGLTVGRTPQHGLPYVLECPIAMACELVGIWDGDDFGIKQPLSHHIVLGRIVECVVGGRWIRDDEVRLEEMPVILYLNRYYAAVGAQLGKQRFTDEPTKREQKMKEYRALGMEEREESRS